MTDEQLKLLLAAADQSAAPLPVPAPDLAARARHAFQQKQRRVRRRALTAVLLSGYAAGLLTMWGVLALTSPRTHPTPSAMVAYQARADWGAGESTISPSPPSVPAPGNALPSPPVQNVSLYRVWRELGDLCQARHQYQMALDYYTRALDVAASGQLEISNADDNWLLISLKRERLQSLRKAKKGNTI